MCYFCIKKCMFRSYDTNESKLEKSLILCMLIWLTCKVIKAILLKDLKYKGQQLPHLWRHLLTCQTMCQWEDFLIEFLKRKQNHQENAYSCQNTKFLAQSEVYLRHAVAKQCQWLVSRFPQAAELSKRKETKSYGIVAHWVNYLLHSEPQNVNAGAK